MKQTRPQTVAQQQTALLEVLLLNTTDFIALSAYSTRAKPLKSLKNTPLLMRGLQAYRANAKALSEAALSASHPVLRQLIGEDNFRHLAHEMWLEMPAERGDVAQWGGALPEFLQRLPGIQALLAEHAYLPDVARLEWALHTVATAPDSMLDTSSFSLLSSHSADRIQLHLCAGCELQTSAFPVAAIVQLHRKQDAASHEQARQAIAEHQNGSPCHALVWRHGWVPRVRMACAAEAALISSTLAGQPLALALDAALAIDAHFDFSNWLSSEVHSGLLVGMLALPHPQKSQS
jgi:Putative DNA-binding domain